MIYFCLFVIFFYIHVFLCGMGSVNGILREKIRPRHAVKFSMPCACRGVKIFDVSCAFQVGQGMSIILTIMVPVSRHDI